MYAATEVTINGWNNLEFYSEHQLEVIEDHVV